MTTKTALQKEAMAYHSEGRPGKIEVIPTKPYYSQRDLSLAYTPGVATPCLEIEKNLDFYFAYVPPSETGIDYPKKIADLEQQLIETQMALCDIYEAMEAMNG